MSCWNGDGLFRWLGVLNILRRNSCGCETKIPAINVSFCQITTIDVSGARGKLTHLERSLELALHCV